MSGTHLLQGDKCPLLPTTAHDKAPPGGRNERSRKIDLLRKIGARRRPASHSNGREDPPVASLRLTAEHLNRLMLRTGQSVRAACEYARRDGLRSLRAREAFQCNDRLRFAVTCNGDLPTPIATSRRLDLPKRHMTKEACRRDIRGPRYPGDEFRFLLQLCPESRLIQLKPTRTVRWLTGRVDRNMSLRQTAGRGCARFTPTH